MYRKRPDRNLMIAGAVLSVLVIVAVFYVIVKPAATGYVVYKEIESANQSVKDYTQSFNEIKVLLQQSKTDLNKCETDNSEFFDKLDEFSTKLNVCEKERGSLEAQLQALKDASADKVKSLEDEIARLDDELDGLRRDQNSLAVQAKDDYAVLAQNLANNICCKQKVDNPDISHFRVENHKIVCLEDGSDAIVCP